MSKELDKKIKQMADSKLDAIVQKKKAGYHHFITYADNWGDDREAAKFAQKAHTEAKKLHPKAELINHGAFEPEGGMEHASLEKGYHNYADIKFPKEHEQKHWGSGKGNPKGDTK